MTQGFLENLEQETIRGKKFTSYKHVLVIDSQQAATLARLYMNRYSLNPEHVYVVSYNDLGYQLALPLVDYQVNKILDINKIAIIQRAFETQSDYINPKQYYLLLKEFLAQAKKLFADNEFMLLTGNIKNIAIQHLVDNPNCLRLSIIASDAVALRTGDAQIAHIKEQQALHDDQQNPDNYYARTYELFRQHLVANTQDYLKVSGVQVPSQRNTIDLDFKSLTNPNIGKHTFLTFYSYSKQYFSCFIHEVTYLLSFYNVGFQLYYCIFSYTELRQVNYYSRILPLVLSNIVSYGEQAKSYLNLVEKDNHQAFLNQITPHYSPLVHSTTELEAQIVNELTSQVLQADSNKANTSTTNTSNKTNTKTDQELADSIYSLQAKPVNLNLFACKSYQEPLVTKQVANKEPIKQVLWEKIFAKKVEDNQDLLLNGIDYSRYKGFDMWNPEHKIPMNANRLRIMISSVYNELLVNSLALDNTIIGNNNNNINALYNKRLNNQTRTSKPLVVTEDSLQLINFPVHLLYVNLPSLEYFDLKEFIKIYNQLFAGFAQRGINRLLVSYPSFVNFVHYQKQQNNEQGHNSDNSYLTSEDLNSNKVTLTSAYPGGLALESVNYHNYFSSDLFINKQQAIALTDILDPKNLTSSQSSEPVNNQDSGHVKRTEQLAGLLTNPTQKELKAKKEQEHRFLEEQKAKQVPQLDLELNYCNVNIKQLITYLANSYGILLYELPANTLLDLEYHQLPLKTLVQHSIGHAFGISAIYFRQFLVDHTLHLAGAPKWYANLEFEQTHMTKIQDKAYSQRALLQDNKDFEECFSNDYRAFGHLKFTLDAAGYLKHQSSINYLAQNINPEINNRDITIKNLALWGKNDIPKVLPELTTIPQDAMNPLTDKVNSPDESQYILKLDNYFEAIKDKYGLLDELQKAKGVKYNYDPKVSFLTTRAQAKAKELEEHKQADKVQAESSHNTEFTKVVLSNKHKDLSSKLVELAKNNRQYIFDHQKQARQAFEVVHEEGKYTQIVSQLKNNKQELLAKVERSLEKEINFALEQEQKPQAKAFRSSLWDYYKQEFQVPGLTNYVVEDEQNLQHQQDKQRQDNQQDKLLHLALNKLYKSNWSSSKDSDHQHVFVIRDEDSIEWVLQTYFYLKINACDLLLVTDNPEVILKNKRINATAILDYSYLKPYFEEFRSIDNASVGQLANVIDLVNNALFNHIKDRPFTLYTSDIKSMMSYAMAMNYNCKNINLLDNQGSGLGNNLWDAGQHAVKNFNQLIAQKWPLLASLNRNIWQFPIFSYAYTGRNMGTKLKHTPIIFRFDN